MSFATIYFSGVIVCYIFIIIMDYLFDDTGTLDISMFSLLSWFGLALILLVLSWMVIIMIFGTPAKFIRFIINLLKKKK